MISYAFWQRELGGDPSVIGRKLTLNDHPTEIIGVTPPGFFGLEVGSSYDVAVPICSQAILWSEGTWLDEGTVWWLNVVGRLKPGATLEQANAQLAVISPRIFQATLPSNYPAVNVKDYLKFKLTTVPAGSGVSWLRNEYSDSLSLLLGTAGLVLLIACANLANLMLARATARTQEFSVRLALGAPRSRLIRQLMTESVLLALLGGSLGMFLARNLSQFLVASLGTEGDPLFLDLRPEWRVLAFTLGLATLTCLLFGLAPGLRASRIFSFRGVPHEQPHGRLRSQTIWTAPAIGRISSCSVIRPGVPELCSSPAVCGTFSRLTQGSCNRGVLVTDLDLLSPSECSLCGARCLQARFYWKRVRALPGVVSAGVVEDSSPQRRQHKQCRLDRKEAIARAGWSRGLIRSRGGYFKAMSIALLAGRDFNDADTVSSRKAAIVNRSFVRNLELGSNPVGRTFRREATPTEPEQSFEIVGVVADTKYSTLREEFSPIAFLCAAQDAQPDPSAEVVIRSTAPMSETVSDVRSLVAQISTLITIGFHPFETTVLEGLMRERLMARLSGFFGLLATLMAALGLYGVMSYLVARRTNEIGIRMALGAQRRDVLFLVLRNAALLLASGLVVGAVLSVALAQTARAMLFGLKPTDPVVLLATVGGLAVIALMASLLPALRAISVDPLVALRYE